MSDTTQQPIELHCRAVLHLSPEHFTIRVPSRAYPFYHYQARRRLGLVVRLDERKVFIKKTQ